MPCTNQAPAQYSVADMHSIKCCKVLYICWHQTALVTGDAPPTAAGTPSPTSPGGEHLPFGPPAGATRWHRQRPTCRPAVPSPHPFPCALAPRGPTLGPRCGDQRNPQNGCDESIKDASCSRISKNTEQGMDRVSSAGSSSSTNAVRVPVVEHNSWSGCCFAAEGPWKGLALLCPGCQRQTSPTD